MNEETKIAQLWTQFNQQNPNADIMEFQALVARQLNCSLQEAKERSQHLLLTE